MQPNLPQRRESAAGEHWYEPIADHLGEAYLRYSFTYGTTREVAFLVDALGLRSGDRVLDVGCGPGRHSLELARRGLDVTGIDIAQRFVDIAAAKALAERLPADFVRADARTYRGEAVDAALCLCQGAFGLVGEADGAVLATIYANLRPGGRFALNAFNAYFAVRHLGADSGGEIAAEDFDVPSGVHHEVVTLRSETGDAATAETWTTCHTPRELRLLCADAGLAVESLSGCVPGEFTLGAPGLDTPEFLVLGHRP